MNRSSRRNSEMNRVPRDREDEPLLMDHNVGRGDRPRRKLPKKCFTCCMVIMLITMVLCAAIAGALGGSYSFINNQVNKIIGQVLTLHFIYSNVLYM